MAAKQQAPEKLRPLVELGFDYDERRMTGREAYGACPFCFKPNHLYANIDTGQWDCKSCGKKGNVYSYMKLWYARYLEEQDSYQQEFISLANDRQLPPDILKEAGIVYDGQRFAMPVYNSRGAIINLYMYRIGDKLKGLPTIDAQLFGVEYFTSQKGHADDRVYIVEGGWDCIALRWLIEKETQEGMVLGTPGTIFKDAWLDFIDGRDVVMCYDHDTAGEKGKERLYYKIKERAKKVYHLAWPTELPEGTDVRDLVTKDCTFAEIDDLVDVYLSPDERDEQKKEKESRIPITSSLRPKWSDVLAVYRKHIHMTQDLEDALRVICAVVLSVRIPGPPLWMHLVAPPGGGKTLLISSVMKCLNVIMRSTLTPHSLISGFVKGGGEDPSLLPKLHHKILAVKDFTTILSMPRVHKDELLGVLRDAYDGNAAKEFGNGVLRQYESVFNMITGVTQQIYGERSASLGERFLMMHIVKGVAARHKDQIRASIRNVGKEVEIAAELTEAAKSFLDVAVNEDAIPQLDEWTVERVIALAELVAMLRASVERDPRGERKLLYRPQHEVATRLAAQFTKLLMGLGLVNTPASIGDDEYRILARIAIDTCVGFNLEAIASLSDNPGQTMDELSADCNLAKNTLRDQVDDLRELGAIRVEVDKGVVTGPGRPVNRYYISNHLRELWGEAGLTRENGVVRSLSRERKTLKVRMVRRMRR
jgi:hypothetical protein